ncbi:flagellar biosynthesis repressor FlbT [Paracoccus methylarcula]|uniref:Flagellar biosynthesis repressor FlbT n=1 Tax=Paracoccus methylarcula TaxID=72022 RepID=A0A3R7LK83_9RHOB|nr:flagellar biosynthesis repressor FlbT [Paracoccus methylarcula]RNF34660.1 flagellar biosynthesis repressor FlbT [Paracoccus methylarcula]
MSGLILKLGPNERVLINGAVIQNCDRRTKLSIKTPNVHVLRLKDAIHPDMANTPVARTCYIAQLILSGDAEPEKGRKQLLVAIEQLSQVFEDFDSRRILSSATEHAIAGNAYQVLRQLKKLLPREARLFAAGEQ